MRKKTTMALFLLSTLVASGQSVKENFDFDWQFVYAGSKGEAKIETAQKQNINLPHDWDIFHAPSVDAPMGNDGGYYPGGVGIYTKTFQSPKLNEGSTCKLHFEGVYQHATVMLNGQEVGTHGYGYTPFSVDITKYLKTDGQPNQLEVKVDNSQQPNCRWYSGSGIYRHVWLEVYEKGAIDDPSKLFIQTEGIYGISADGTHADSATIRISYDGQKDELRTYSNVKLWSPEHPELYDIAYGKLKVKHGFRTFIYSAQEGCRLNGQPIKINGACVHHDDGILGAMAFDAAEIRKVRLMKEAGFNLIRTSHNPQTRAMLDACDSLGMMVIDEAFDGWYSQKTAHDYHELIAANYADDIAAMVLRDRNHPSVICWSIGNEVIERKEIKVVQTAREMKKVVLELDKTRPVTEALCSWDNDWEIFDPHAEVLDIVGYNYMMHKAQSDHERCPERVMWQTESYPRDAFKNWQNTNRNDFIIGDIVWTGLDYLGESGIGQFYYDGEPRGEHYNGQHFPFHGAYCGDVDMTGWRKPISHYRDMLWNVKDGESDFIYMAVREPNHYYNGDISETAWSVWPTWESWNWYGWEGKTIEVEIYTKARGVKLYLNDKLICTTAVSEAAEYKAIIPVTYEPGTLRAVAVDDNGNDGAMTMLTTSGKAYSLRLTPERKVISADGQDLAYITLEVVDQKGIVVPDAEVDAEIEVKGTGKFLAAGSASFKDLEPTTTNRVRTYKGCALIVVRSTKKAGNITITAKSALKRTTTVLVKTK